MDQLAYKFRIRQLAGAEWGSLARLAKRAGVSHSTIMKFADMKVDDPRGMSCIVAEKLCAALNVEKKDLYTPEINTEHNL